MPQVIPAIVGGLGLAGTVAGTILTGVLSVPASVGIRVTAVKFR